MNSQIRDFFRTDKAQEAHFQEVRFLSEEPGAVWDEVKGTGIPRGWFELSRVSMSDRVDFTREFWLSLLPYHPTASAGIREFFDQLDDVAVILCRQTKEEPWRAELAYSLADNSSFFRGLAPADEEEIDWTMKKLNVNLPSDFRAFQLLHNGFGKLTELGVVPLDEMEDARESLISALMRADKPLRSGERVVDPYSLYPFYEEFGGGCQCFYSEWYPASEMGNVYFSAIDYIISDTSDRKGWPEHLAYPTFVEWLSSFINGMSVSF